MAQAESITDNIAFQVNEAYRTAVTAWVGIATPPGGGSGARELPARATAAREGAATPTEIADAQASLTRAQQNYLNARYNYLIAMDRLEYATGVGTDADDLAQTSLAGTKPGMRSNHECDPSAQALRAKASTAAPPRLRRVPRRSPEIGFVRPSRRTGRGRWTRCRRARCLVMSWIEYRRDSLDHR